MLLNSLVEIRLHVMTVAVPCPRCHRRGVQELHRIATHGGDQARSAWKSSRPNPQHARIHPHGNAAKPPSTRFWPTSSDTSKNYTVLPSGPVQADSDHRHGSIWNRAIWNRASCSPSYQPLASMYCSRFVPTPMVLPNWGISPVDCERERLCRVQLADA